MTSATCLTYGDAERLAALRKAIASGAYHVDPRRVAEGMIRYGEKQLALRSEIVALEYAGCTWEEIGRRVGRSETVVGRLLADARSQVF